MSDAAKRANQSRWTVLDHDPDRAKRHDLSARGTMPELWLCVDCGLNTAPGMPDRKQADLALAIFGETEFVLAMTARSTRCAMKSGKRPAWS